MLPEDRNAFLAYIQENWPVVVTNIVANSAEVMPVNLIDRSQWLCIWNRKLLPLLERKLIRNAQHELYRVDEQHLPVLEFSTSCLRVVWDGRPALVQGRIFGIFEGKPPEFKKWYEALVRWIKQNFQRHPTGTRGYVGPHAHEFYRKGGYLLPIVVPPETKVWLREIRKQHREVEIKRE